MATLKISIPKIKRLYNINHMSAADIARQFGVSLDAVYYFLRRHKIPRRGAAEQNRLHFENKGASFFVKQKLTAQQQKLLVAGVMLYWGEGSQWSGETSVDFANSNPHMIRVFIKFLRVICQVSERRLRCYLYCYSNQSVPKLLKFWSSVTKISRHQFTKPYVKKTTKKGIKNGKMPYGLVHIRYSDKKLLILLREWITIIPRKLLK